VLGHRLGPLALETRDERRDSSLARAEGMIGTALVFAVAWAYYLAGFVRRVRRQTEVRAGAREGGQA
jgi:hypothetical protein